MSQVLFSKMESNRRLNVIKGISAGLILLLGIGFFLWYRYGTITDSSIWIIIAVIGGIVLLFIAGVFFLPRTRIQKTSRTFEYRTDQHNREYFETGLLEEGKDFVPAKKLKQKTVFCSYCGASQEEVKICTNCGRSLDY